MYNFPLAVLSPLGKRSGAASGPNGAPSNATLVVDSDTQMTVSWTNGATNQGGSRVYISTDHVTFTEKGTTSGIGTSFVATGLTASTQYYFYVVHYSGSTESNRSNIASAATYADIMSDGNTDMWFMSYDIDKFTITGDMGLSAWGEHRSNGKNLTGGGAALAKAMAQGVRFNGASSNAYNTTAIVPPLSIYVYAKPLGWTEGDVLFGAGALRITGFRQTTATPSTLHYNGSYAGGTDDFTLNAWHRTESIFNGANSLVKVDDHDDIPCNLGVLVPTTGFYLGGSSGGSYMICEVKEVIVRTIADTDLSRTKIRNYFKAKYENPLNTICILGDSNHGLYSPGWFSVYQYMTGTFNFQSLAASGETIAQQKTRFDNLGISDIACTFVCCGNNDINAGTNAATIINSFQGLIDDIRSVVGSSNKIVAVTYTPIRSGWGDVKYATWLAVNAAIRGEGATPITGADSVITSITTELDDGDGNLKAEYDAGDHLHAINNARYFMAQKFNEKLVEYLIS